MAWNKYRVPKNKLPRAKGMGDSTYHFESSPEIFERGEKSRINFWGISFEEAYKNPGVTQYWYMEENNYEYEERYTWYPDTKTMVTNTGCCPNMNGHHLGVTCGICKQFG